VLDRVSQELVAGSHRPSRAGLRERRDRRAEGAHVVRAAPVWRTAAANRQATAGRGRRPGEYRRAARMRAGGNHRAANGTGAGRALRAAERIMGRPVTLEECGRVLKAEEAAEFLGLDVSTVRHLTCRGELTYIKTGKRGVAYQLIDLIEWLEARRVPARL
jgi:excisionase family DNA binding protein